MINFIFLMTVLQHPRHANEGTYITSFKAPLDSRQVTLIRNQWGFFWNLSVNLYLSMESGVS